MKFILLVYNDPALFDALPASEFDSRMRGCFAHADELRDEGRLLESQQLGGPATARTVRVRNGRTTTTDGPFAEAKDIVLGFLVVEARDLGEATELASGCPMLEGDGTVEIRPVSAIAT